MPYPIIQWNCQGARTRKQELLDLIQNEKPVVLAIQETKLQESTTFNLPGYTCYRKEGHFNRTPHGGVAIFVHQDIAHNLITVNTTLQSISVQVNLGRTVTISSIYTSRSHVITEELFNDLIRQLPKPVLLLGDLNSYNQIWGCDTTDARGRIIENVVNTNNLNIINDGRPTRITHNSSTAIDISICSPQIEPLLDWNVLSSPMDSDHNPIILTWSSNQNEENNTRFNYKLANWDNYKNHRTWTNIPDNVDDDCESSVNLFYEKINKAASESIPTYTTTKYFPKPWWCIEVTNSRNKREQLYKTFIRTKSLQHMIAWKKARAECKQLIKVKKKESWTNLTSDINRNTPISKVYETIRRIQGRKERRIHILLENNTQFSTITEITNKLAQTFSHISNSHNYSPEFQIEKTRREREQLNFASNGEENYNKPLTVHELNHALKKTHSTSPGPDKVTIEMIKNLPDSALEYFLKLMNLLFKNSFFPNTWREAIVVPIEKPGKDPSNPINYRPIALTSVICKTMERILNDRLLDYLNMNKNLTNIQSGGRKYRSTDDHLIRLESTIRKAFSRNEHLISVFFDVEKAYDKTWKYGILKDLHNYGLRGLLPKFIEQFLKNRTFKVRVNSTLSDSVEQENGVPQGSVLSVTLFIIKINQIANLIPKNPRMVASLYIDDLQLSFRHTDLNEIKTTLQETINTIYEWSSKNGFKFSETKTRAMHFTIMQGLHLSPDLTLNEQPIAYVDNYKFLGLIWDQKLTWRPHLLYLKKRCQKPISLLKSIVSLKWGADQNTVMLLYRSLIRSKLDYGSIIYCSASKTNLDIIKAIPTEVMRIASGAFRTTPVATLHVLTNEIPIEMRRMKLTMQYYFKTRSQLSNPAYNNIIDTGDKRLYEARNTPIPFSVRVHNLLETLNITKRAVKVAFSYNNLNISTPTWLIQPPKVNLELAKLSKLTTAPVIYQQNFLELYDENYSEYTAIYTDGSKMRAGVGSAAVSEENERKATLPSEASIYSAEIYAIELAISMIKSGNSQNYIILSDSLSSLQKLQELNYDHPTVRKIQHDIFKLASENKNVEFCWIPGHAGIHGNDRADSLAKLATSQPKQFIPIHYKDWYPIIKEKITEKWNDEWKRSRNKMLEIKPNVGEWAKEKYNNRKEQVVVNRLRCGHTLLTQQHLMEVDAGGFAPPCPLCNEAGLSVRHVMMDCQVLEQERRRHFNGPLNFKALLTDNKMKTKMLTFVRNIGLFDEV